MKIDAETRKKVIEAFSEKIFDEMLGTQKPLPAEPVTRAQMDNGELTVDQLADIAAGRLRVVDQIAVAPDDFIGQNINRIAAMATHCNEALSRIHLKNMLLLMSDAELASIGLMRID